VDLKQLGVKIVKNTTVFVALTILMKNYLTYMKGLRRRSKRHMARDKRTVIFYDARSSPLAFKYQSKSKHSSKTFET